MARSAPRLYFPYPLGALRAFRAGPLHFLTETCGAKGEVVRFRVAHLQAFFLRHPEGAKHVLVDNVRNYDKHTRGYNLLRSVLGRGLLTSEGDFWRRQRRIAQPAFHRKRIAAFAQTMVEVTEQTLDEWEDVAALGRTFDIAEEMGRIALRIVGKTLFGTEVSGLTQRVSKAVGVINEYMNKASTDPFAIPLRVPTPTNRRLTRHSEALDTVVFGLIEQRRRSGEDPGDLLSMLMHAEDAETGERMSDEQLRDEVMTIFLAGHETTANALAWTFYLLSLHPDAERRLRAELDDVLGGRRPTLEDLARLGYLERVVKESMRLYPPVWILDRRCVAPDEVMGYRIPAGALVLVSPYVTHRHARWWPNPEGFDPDRFLPEGDKARPRYAYFPFGGGPRLCIGNAFAMMEAQLVIATVMRRFRPWLVPGYRVRPATMVTLRPGHGIPMRLDRIRAIAAA